MSEIAGLKEVIERLRQHHEYLLTLAGQKMTAIGKADRQALEEIVRFEQEERRVLRQLEAERMSIVSALIERYCPHLERNAPIAEWLPYLPEQERRDIEGARENLQTRLNDLRAKNELNQQLLEDGLVIVRATLDALQREEGFITYTSAADAKVSNGYERYSAIDSRA
ncbi:flagellar protein FlgN [Natribacillus halophilus]|uniref:FlgN protein n=1 Tax=Natribacillus halophilus TaxID=549003 RepID=A0A1G8KNT9_9BACI|nr:flagellar protein FlgN [Natribacillus halophilus]SDI45078.1 FlgN protein [Natribacillus halophilus]